MLFAKCSGTSVEEQNIELWRISVDGGEPQKLGLSMEGRELYGLSVHPDGQRIAFTAGTPSLSEVWVIEDPLRTSVSADGSR